MKERREEKRKGGESIGDLRGEETAEGIQKRRLGRRGIIRPQTQISKVISEVLGRIGVKSNYSKFRQQLLRFEYSNSFPHDLTRCIFRMSTGCSKSRFNIEYFVDVAN